MLKRAMVFCGLVLLPSIVSAQANSDTDETGAVNVWISSGWSFGLPANRALVSIPGVGTAISPEKKNLIAPGAGVSLTVWKNVVPFFALSAYDAGTATASVGPYQSRVSGEILSLNGGVRLLASHSRIRPYAEFGGGVLYQKPNYTFTTPSGSTSDSESASIGNVMFGGGVQMFVGRRWGIDVGLNGFHLMEALGQGGSNFTRVRIGFFFQTKSRLP